MKILVTTPYIYNKEWPEFCKNKTGFGIMVFNIFKYLKKKNDVYLFSNVITKGRPEGIVKHTFPQVFLDSHIVDWFLGIKEAARAKISLREKIHLFYYVINKGFFQKTIENIRPDIVHVHGLGVWAKIYIEECEKANVPYVVTLHGLIGLDKTVKASKEDINHEKSFLVDAENKGTPITVISTGIKERIENEYLKKESNTIEVICNGCETNTEQTINNSFDANILEKAKKDNKKICVCIGNISENKNQIEAIKIVERLDNAILVLFGRECDGGECREYVEKNGLHEKIFFMGFVDDLSSFIRLADLNIFVSKNDGFGLSIIECMTYGVPSVMYEDLDSSKDVGNELAVRVIPRKSLEYSTEVVKECLNKSWNREDIKSFSINFSLDKMADEYTRYFTRIIDSQ